ncbi:hypothetical protein [Streptomyces paromomycinus]|uniref:Uncharacterized protein n=1 Tax=Streptomyces paromomycinus TaxID=92743 RepID=A0A401W0L1_STREY|nr:hypothetical protein [Streptomyces paromomycinus]GCD42825.1 hypothetical protein GKJPGBOP_02499 [Streptomyces paromomycinus]
MTTKAAKLRYTSYDNNPKGWTPTSEVPGAESSFAPAVEAYKDLLYCFHQDMAGSSSTLWWTHTAADPVKWRDDEPVHDADGRTVPCAGAPAVTHANDFLYCVNHRSSKDASLWWSRYNTEGEEAGWRNWQALEDSEHSIVRSSLPPELTVYDGLVYCVHDDENGRLKWITYDTHAGTWGEDRPIPGGIPVKRALAVERYKGLLYCLHDGADDCLYWITYDSKTGEWSQDQRVKDVHDRPVKDARTPGLSRYNDGLYCVYHRGPDSGRGKLHWIKFLDGRWSTEQPGPSTQSAPGLDTAPYSGLLHLVYRG